MPLKLAKLGTLRLPTSKSDPSDISNALADPSPVETGSYFPDVVPEDSPVISSRTSSVSPARSPLGPPQRHASSHGSSPLAQYVSNVELSPRVQKRSLSGLLKRSKSKAPDVEPISSPPSPEKMPSSPVVPTARPKLSLRTRSGSITGFMRSRSDTVSTARPTSPTSPETEELQGEFTLKSFRSATGENSPVLGSPRPGSPINTSPPKASPTLSSPQLRQTPPLPVRRPSSQVFNDPIANAPNSTSVKASFFQNAKANRSTSSLQRVTSFGSDSQSIETLSRPPSRLDLPLPPPLARPREPLSFTPPAAHRSTMFELGDSTARPSSPSPSLSKLEAPAFIRPDAFAPPKPAFLSSNDRRNSMPIESGRPESPRSPTTPNQTSLPHISRASSERTYAATAKSVRDKAKELARSAYAYANEKTEAAAALQSTSEEDTSFDATIDSDSEDGLSDGSSHTSHTKDEERVHWGSDAALEKRAQAQKQVMEASKRFSNSWVASSGEKSPTPASVPLFALGITSEDPVEEILAKKEEQEALTMKVLDRPRPVTRARTDSIARPSPARTPSNSSLSSSQMRASRPPSVPRHRSIDSRSSFSGLSPTLSTGRASFDSTRSPPEAYGRSTRATSYTPIPVPAGVDAAMWSSLPIEQQLAIEEQGRAYTSMLARQAYEVYAKTGRGDTTPRFASPPVSPIAAHGGSWARQARERSQTGG